MLVAETNDRGFMLGRTFGQLVVSGPLDRERVESIQLALVRNPGPVTGETVDSWLIVVN